MLHNCIQKAVADNFAHFLCLHVLPNSLVIRVYLCELRD